MIRIATTFALALSMATLVGCTDDSKPPAVAVSSTSAPAPSSSSAAPAGPVMPGAPTAAPADIARCEAAVPALNAWIDAAQALEAGALKPAEAADSMTKVMAMLAPPAGASATNPVEVALAKVSTEVGKMRDEYVAMGAAQPAAAGNAFDGVTTACKNAGAYGSQQPGAPGQ